MSAGQRAARALLDVIPARLLWKHPNGPRTPVEPAAVKVSLFIVTYNRVEMLQQCVESLLPTLKPFPCELIIWNNASTDGTASYLERFNGHPFIWTVHHPENIGVNAKSRAAGLCTGDFLVGIDDDVIAFQADWLERMLTAYRVIPSMGYLASDVVQDERTTGAKWPPEQYRREAFAHGSVSLQIGPTGGWCYMISRTVYNDVGPLLQREGRKFFLEDADYVNRCINAGYRYGILEGVRNYHACGIVHNAGHQQVFEAKMADFQKGDDLGWRLRKTIGNLTSIRRYLYKLREYAFRNVA